MAATRTKTIEYAFTPKTTTLADNVRHDFAAVTLYIPETTSRTFKSVTAVITFRSSDVAGLDIFDRLIGIKLGAEAFDDVTTTDDIVDSGEHTSYTLSRNVTAYFEANFGAGASQTCQIGVAINTTAMDIINICAKLIITYEYDDTAHATRVKTVYIPIESPTAVLSAVSTEIGTNQVPDLDDLLPEDSVVYRDIFFEVWGNEASVTTDDFQVGLQLDAEGEALDGSHEQALNSAINYHYIWKRTDMGTADAHAFKARTTVASRICFLTVVLVVTYEYNHTNSTSIMNSLMLPVDFKANFDGLSTSPDRAQFDIYVEEPTTITLKQSGLLLSYNLTQLTTETISFRAGSQAYRSYSYVRGTTCCGYHQLMQRVDSGGAQGAGMTLARGKNTITVDLYRAGTDANACGDQISCLLYLNYTSGKHTDGDGVHSHTTYWDMCEPGGSAAAFYSDLGRVWTAASSITILEANYFMVGLALIHETRHQYDNCERASAQRKAGEGSESGYEMLSEFKKRGSGESGDMVHVGNIGPSFYRYASDPEYGRLNPETSRILRYFNTLRVYRAYRMLATWHSITFDIAGDLSDFAGDGSGITVEAHRTDTGELVGTDTSAVGGGYSITWYDNTIDCEADAREDATHVGRSDDGAAS